VHSVKLANPLSGRVIVALLFVVNVVLVLGALHLRHGNSAPPSPSFTVSPRPHSSDRSQPGSSVLAATKGPAPLLTESGPAFALVATGGCKADAQLFGSINNLYSLAGLTSPAKHILRVTATGPSSAWLVGADTNCRPTYYATTDKGLNWSASNSLGRVWVPSDRGVRAPSGSTSSPCGSKSPEPIALAVSTPRQAMVICRVGVFRTVDAGATWLSVDTLPAGRPVNLALTKNGHGVLLLTGLGDCSGLRVALTRDGGASWLAGECLADAHSPAAVALDAHGDGIVNAQGRRYRTVDGGTHWA
jgi:hypothetical protein